MHIGVHVSRRHPPRDSTRSGFSGGDRVRWRMREEGELEPWSKLCVRSVVCALLLVVASVCVWVCDLGISASIVKIA